MTKSIHARPDLSRQQDPVILPGLAPKLLASLIQDSLTVIFFRWRRVNLGNLTSSTPRL
jgi:hypothetical protein